MSKEIKFESVMNLETKESKASVSPEPQSFEDIVQHITNVINASTVMLDNLFSCLPTVREVTDEERELHTYVYVSESDRKVMEWRKRMYKEVSSIFNTLLENSFVDVIYVESCKQYYETLAFENSEEVVEKYKSSVGDLRIALLDKLIEEAKEELNNMEKPEPEAVESESPKED